VYDIKPDRLFDCLSNHRRRGVVLELESGPTTLSEVAENIARLEKGREPDSDEKKTVYVCLYQSHVDMMDEAGIIDYDKRSKRIEKGENYTMAMSVLGVVQSLADEGIARREKSTLEKTEELEP